MRVKGCQCVVWARKAPFIHGCDLNADQLQHPDVLVPGPTATVHGVACMQVLAIALLLLYVTGSFADQPEGGESSTGSGDQKSSSDSKDSGLTSIEAARRNVRFEASKCKGADGGKAAQSSAVKPGGCSGQSRTTFACCTYNGACQLPRTGEDFKGSGCRYLWWGACCSY